MKVKTLIACAATAAAFPLGQTAWASATPTTLGGPQGTGYYGVVDPLDRDRDGVVDARERAAAPTAADPRAPDDFATYDRNGDGFISSSEFAALNDARLGARDDRGEPRNRYSGPSWATNPPAPS